MEFENKLLHEHQEIAKSSEFLNNFQESFSKDDVAEYMQSLNKFYKDEISDHFKWEEETLFPIILERGNPLDNQLINELLEDHIAIKARFNNFRDLVLLFDENSDNSVFTKIMNTCADLHNIVVVHAKKEEENLIPILKK